MTVLWTGSSPNWGERASKPNPTFVMPLIEEEVLSTAFLLVNDDLSSKRTLRGLSVQAAINCTSRLAMRVALSVTRANPDWKPIEMPINRRAPLVVKAPASTMSDGVRVFSSTESTYNLSRHAWDLASIGVMEEYIPGEQWEIDGCAIGGRIMFFHALLQIWNKEGTKIIDYRRNTNPSPDMLSTARKAIRALGLNDCPFCLELRSINGQWIIIEAHARLGEDPGLPAKMWDEDPREQIERWCEAWG